MIYFLCHPDPCNYQWDIIPLAEGLEEMGVPFCSNANYWIKPDGKYLLRSDSDVDPLSADAVVVSTGFLNWARDAGSFEHGELPDWLIDRAKPSRTKVVGLDVSDGYLSPITTRWAHCFDIILRAHYNRRMWWPANVRPWAFGLSARIIAASKKARAPWEKRGGCLFAFGASHGFSHGGRQWASERILPKLAEVLCIDSSQDDLKLSPDNPEDALLWKQCVRRHSPSFFKRLGEARACAAFCGELVPGLPQRVNFLVGGNKARAKRIFWELVSQALGLPPRNVQPDSWRFWESLACWTATIHFDMEQSGWEMPVMPENLKHYIGVDLRNPEETIKRLQDDPALLQRVAHEGREWAIANYSPKAAACRLLDMLI